MRAPVDRRDATFDELVAEVLLELELDAPRDLAFLDDDEDGMLAFLADGQRRHGRSLRSDATAAALWRFWVANSRHAGAWRRGV